MARATRSTVAQQEKDVKEKDKQPHASPPATRTKQGSKKRKRPSLVDHEGQPLAKQLRGETGEPEVKEEETELASEPSNAGDLPLNEEDARKVLDVLEMIDTQGLLDRVFPLPTDLSIPESPSTPSTSKLSPNTYSLRTLLKESQDHPLRILRSAIYNLFPISSQPRSRTSPPATQQLLFCQLALLLLDTASKHNINATSLDFESVLPNQRDTDNGLAQDKDYSSLENRRKYALMQKLPGGEWWTSLDYDLHSLSNELKDMKSLGTAHAELVSILPSPSSSSKPTPLLGDFYAGKKAPGKAKLPGHRQLSSGSFLDYGPYTSFAPSFDNDGCEIGRYGLGGVLWRRYEKRRAKEKARILKERMQSKKQSRGEEMEVDEVVEVCPVQQWPADKAGKREKEKELLESLLPHEEASSLHSMSQKLDQEEGVSELLASCARALVRLEDLQQQRLHGDKDRSIETEMGSEEWETAQKLMDALTFLASMRPRSSVDSASPIVPPRSVLRAVHSTLPCQPSQGWYGTLSESRGTALRDDTTLHVKPGVTVQPSTSVTAPSASASASIPTPASTTAQAPNPAYAAQAYPQQNYAYPNYSQQYRGSYPYPQGQSSSYYPNVFHQSTNPPQSQPGAPQYPAQGFAGANQPHQYPYGGWYANYQPPAATAATTSGAHSGQGTPQPAAATAGYPGYFAAATQAPTRAVANTVTPKPQQNGWTAGMAGYAAAPTLPLHLRPAGTAPPTTPGTPGTPGTAQATGFNAQGYYPGYPQQTPVAGSSVK